MINNNLTTMPGAREMPRAQASLSGRIGENSASLTLWEQGDRVDLSGFVGSNNVNIHEYRNGSSAQISGNVWGSAGYQNVSIWVNSSVGSKDFSGFIGNQNVNVHQYETGNSLQISGWIGQKYVNVHGDKYSGSAHFNGHSGNGLNSNIWLSAYENPSGQNISYDALIPTFILTGK